MQPGGFLPFLPNDDASVPDASTEQAVKRTAADLQRLLESNAEQFWDTVLHDASLNNCIDTYLRFRRRSHDPMTDGVHGPSELHQQLAKRVFMVLLRMVSCQEFSRGVPSTSQLAQWLYEQRPLDVPKLMDVAVLYSASNPTLTTKLIHQVFTLQPLLLEELTVLVGPLTDSLTQLQDRMLVAASKAVRGEAGSARPLLDCVAYLRDLSATLGCFVGSYPPAAALLLAPAHGSLLACVAALHDKLLPALLRGVGSQGAVQGTGVTAQEAAAQVQLAAVALQQLAVQLVGLGYLLPPAQAAAAVASAVGDDSSASGGSSAGPSGSAGGSGGGSGASSSAYPALSSSSHAVGGSSSRQASSSSYAGGSSSSSASRQAGGSSSRAAGSAGASSGCQLLPGGWDAETRGTQLMSALMNAAHMEGSGAGGPGGEEEGAALLHVVNRQFSLDVAVACAMKKGDLILDDAQFDYLMALLDSQDRTKVDAAVRTRLTQPAAANPATSSAAAGPSAATSSSVAGPSSSRSVDPTVLASLVSQIVDVLGAGYGEGYLHACLHTYQYSAEEVIHHLLEGSLSPELQTLDTQLRTWHPPGPAPAPAASSSSSATAGPSWVSAAKDASQWQRSEAQAAAARAAKVVPGTSTSVQSSRSQVHRGVARVLDRIDREAKEATKVLANELQFEYDDEYDDSMDDLIRGGTADGVCDIEGDDDQYFLKQQAGATYDDEPDTSGPAGRRGGAAAGSRSTAASAGGRRAARAPLTAPGSGSASGSAAAAAAGRGRGPAGGASAGAQGARGRGSKPGKHWVLDGRIYNYAKEGAQEVSSMEEAEKAVQAAKEAALAIHGLGAGGNKGAAGSRWHAIQQQAAASAQPSGGRPGGQPTTDAHGDEDGAEGQQQQRQWGPDARKGGRIDGDGGRGGGREGGGGGGGRGAPNFARKEQNKAAVGNHHRKDRAMKKAGLL